MKVLILNNIRSAENVGSMFRTADAFGVDKIYISGYTPSPVDRFGRAMGKLVKAALGAEKSVQWEKVADASECIRQLKEQNKELAIIALEQDSRSVNLKSYRPPDSWALIVGNEVEGVDKAVLDHAQVIVEIPMQGAKESLNVAVSCGIALHHLTS